MIVYCVNGRMYLSDLCLGTFLSTLLVVFFWGELYSFSYDISSSACWRLDACLARASDFSLLYRPQWDEIHWMATLWLSHWLVIAWERLLSSLCLFCFSESTTYEASERKTIFCGGDCLFSRCIAHFLWRSKFEPGTLHYLPKPDALTSPPKCPY